MPLFFESKRQQPSFMTVDGTRRNLADVDLKFERSRQTSIVQYFHMCDLYEFLYLYAFYIIIITDQHRHRRTRLASFPEELVVINLMITTKFKSSSTFYFSMGLNNHKVNQRFLFAMLPFLAFVLGLYL